MLTKEVNSKDKDNAQSMEAPLTPQSFLEAKGRLWKHFVNYPQKDVEAWELLRHSPL